MGTTAEKLAYLADTKADIRAAMVEKGIEVPTEIPFRQYGDLIRSLPSSKPEIKTLDQMTWEEISIISDSGQGENYWNVGDRKSIVLNGIIRDTPFSNVIVDVFIVGFNHNESKEGGKRIHFQIGQISLINVALAPSNLESSDGEGFVFNQTSSNSGGWESSYMRNIILGNSGTPQKPIANSLLAALPTDLRSVMKTATKYTNNSGGTNSQSAVTATNDYLSIPSEFEIMGSQEYANVYEQQYQEQYQYYKNGGKKNKYRHDNTGRNCSYWTRSAKYDTVGSVVLISGGGGPSYMPPIYSEGISPVFYV